MGRSLALSLSFRAYFYFLNSIITAADMLVCARARGVYGTIFLNPSCDRYGRTVEFA